MIGLLWRNSLMKINFIQWVFILSVALAVSGCGSLGHWKQLKTDQSKVFRHRGFSATIPEGWMQFKRTKYFHMSKDGTALDWIGVERLKFDDELENTKKKISASMLVDEIA